MQKLIFFLLLFPHLSFAQQRKDPTDSLITVFRAKMEQENISDFFLVKHITYGGFRIFDSDDPNACRIHDRYFTMYAFWKDGRQTWVKKYDNCGGFKAIKLSKSTPIEFYKKHLDQLKTENVREYALKIDTISHNKFQVSAMTEIHGPHRYFWFYNNNVEFIQNFSKFQLETSKEDKNLNYEYNHSLAIVQLNTICEEIISNLYINGRD